jgi:hypothetical protein
VVALNLAAALNVPLGVTYMHGVAGLALATGRRRNARLNTVSCCIQSL